MGKYRVAIVIPAFNEDLTIKNVINSVKPHGDVIVVNDASTDNTEVTARNCGAFVINHDLNKGYEAALDSGIKKAAELKYDAFITFDADGQHSPQDLMRFVELLHSSFDLVLGIRPRNQRFAEWVFKKYTNFFLNWKDPLCGMKGYSMNLYRDKGCFASYNSVGTELAHFGITNHYKYTQIELNINERQDKPRFSSIMKANIIIFKALINIIFRSYK